MAEQLECAGSEDAGRRFDLVILDPPSFARSRQSRYAAIRAYTRLNALALRCVAPGGLLATASCTSQVGPEEFKQMLAAAGASADRRLQIVHEALHNVWRHSNATAVDIVVAHADGTVTLRVSDDGAGFDTDTMAEGPGLASMRSSATVVGGTMEITSRVGEGTVIEARLGDVRGPWPDPPRPRPAPKRSPNLRLVTG